MIAGTSLRSFTTVVPASTASGVHRMIAGTSLRSFRPTVPARQVATWQVEQAIEKLFNTSCVMGPRPPTWWQAVQHIHRHSSGEITAREATWNGNPRSMTGVDAALASRPSQPRRQASGIGRRLNFPHAAGDGNVPSAIEEPGARAAAPSAEIGRASSRERV